MKVVITITFCGDNLLNSKFMALEKSGEFFSRTMRPPCHVFVVLLPIDVVLWKCGKNDSLSVQCVMCLCVLQSPGDLWLASELHCHVQGIDIK